MSTNSPTLTVVQGTPSILASVWLMLGHNLEVWVLLATLIYTMLLTGVLIYKIFKGKI